MISPYVYPGLPNMTKREAKKWNDNESVSKIVDEVCFELEVFKSELKTKTRKGDVCEARHICVYLIKKNTLLSLKSVGALFNRDHASVIHSIKTVEDLYRFDKDYKRRLDKIKNRL